MEMIIPKSSWGDLVKHSRSTLGFLLSVIIILAIILLVTLLSAHLPINSIYIILAIFFITTMVFAVWVIKRTPKTPHGLVATEEYYALLEYLEFSKSYGSEGQPENRKEALKKKRIAKQIMLPSPERKELLNKETL